MRKHIIGTIMAIVASTGIASAGSLDVGVNLDAASQAVANSQSRSGAVAQSNNSIVYNTPAQQNIRYGGSQTIRSAPQVVAPSMSSGHPCAYAPVSIGVSVVGFGGAFGGQRIDDACLLAQMQVRNAAIAMIAMRNRSACRALEATGNIPAGYCGGSRRTAAAAPAPAARKVVRTSTAKAVAPYPRVGSKTTMIPRGSVKCTVKAGKVVKIERWARVNNATAVAFCAAKVRG